VVLTTASSHCRGCAGAPAGYSAVALAGYSAVALAGYSAIARKP